VSLVVQAVAPPHPVVLSNSHFIRHELMFLHCFSFDFVYRFGVRELRGQRRLRSWQCSFSGVEEVVLTVDLSRWLIWVLVSCFWDVHVGLDLVNVVPSG
jgi:hypothetical protein